jgi:hypothetical protein
VCNGQPERGQRVALGMGGGAPVRQDQRPAVRVERDHDREAVTTLATVAIPVLA